MKYLLILIILLFTGCNSITLDLNNIKSINYNNIDIIEEDYKTITDNLNNVKFNCSNNKKINGNELKIVTDKYLYNLTLSNNTIQLKNKDNYCNSNTVDNLYKQLNKLIETYNSDFYTISYTNNYIENSNDEIIKIDKNDNYLVINTFNELYDFKINEIDSNYKEINLIYNKDKINSNNIIIRKDDFTNIKISFLNKYNYLVTIIPYIENDILKFNENKKQLNF